MSEAVISLGQNTLNSIRDAARGGVAGLPAGAMIGIDDLFEVYPELAVEDHFAFRDQIKLAAQFSRGHNAYHAVREGFEDAAVSAGVETALDILEEERKNDEETEDGDE